MTNLVRWLFGGNLLTGVFWGVILIVLVATALVFLVSVSFSGSWIAPEQLFEWLLSLSQYVYHILRAILEETWNGRDRCATMGGTELESPARSGDKTYKAPHVNLMLSSSSDSVNQGGGSNETPLTIDLNRPAQDQEDIPAHTGDDLVEQIAGGKIGQGDADGADDDKHQRHQVILQEVETVNILFYLHFAPSVFLVRA